MKKLFISIIALLLLSVPASYAGDSANALLRDKSSKMFFGELAENQGDSVVIKPIYNVKGEFDPDTLIQVPIDCCDVISGRTAETGKLYLCGLSGTSIGINLCNLSEDTAEADFDRNALIGDSVTLYLWEFDTMDTSTIKLNAADSFSMEIQEYLNQGLFDKAEQDRLYHIHLQSRPKVSAAAPAQSNETVILPSQSAQKQLKTLAWPWAAGLCAAVTAAAVILYIKRR